MLWLAAAPGRLGLAPLELGLHEPGLQQGHGRRAVLRLEFSFWHWTTIFVGRCVMRTAESVLL